MTPTKSFQNILIRLLVCGLAMHCLFAEAEEPSFLEKFGTKFLKKESELLEADEAFKVKVAAKDKKTVVVTFTPAPSYYLYRHKISFNSQTKDIKVTDVVLPVGELKKDIIYGETRVFHQPFEGLIALQNTSASDLKKLHLQVSYQGCSERGVCYPPITKVFEVDLPSAYSKHSSNVMPTTKEASSFSSDTKIAESLTSKAPWLVLSGFFLAGIGLAFTPCVLPMIPILSSIIVGHGQIVTRKRGFLLSLSYVLGMSIAYTAAGVAASLTGSFLAIFLQNPWVLGSLATIFVLLSMSMFGLYELRAPSFITNQANSLSNKLSGGKVVAVFGMGALSALIVSPCVAAPLAGALLYIGQTGDVILGGSALFFLAIGMGAPLIAIGVSAGSILPKSGSWMGAVKKLFGVILLGVAIWIISPVIPLNVQMALWAVLLIISACFLRALDSLPLDAKGGVRFSKGIGIVSLIIGIGLLIGALSGGKNILQPLANIGNDKSEFAKDSQLAFEKVQSVEDLTAKLKQTDRPVMLDFYADWCVSCKEMEAFTFKDAKVISSLNNFLLLKADVTQNTNADQQLLKYFSLVGPPGIIFFDKNGKEMRDHRVVGFLPANEFYESIDKALSSRNTDATKSAQNSF